MELRYTRRSERDLERLDPQVRVRVEQAIARLMAGLASGHRLTGRRRAFYSLRVGAWREIYRLLERETIVIEGVGHRREVYRRG